MSARGALGAAPKCSLDSGRAQGSSRLACCSDIVRGLRVAAAWQCGYFDGESSDRAAIVLDCREPRLVAQVVHPESSLPVAAEVHVLDVARVPGLHSNILWMRVREALVQQRRRFFRGLGTDGPIANLPELPIFCGTRLSPGRVVRYAETCTEASRGAAFARFVKGQNRPFRSSGTIAIAYTTKHPMVSWEVRSDCLVFLMCS